MKAIEARINGKIVCHAGLPKHGNLAAILNLIALTSEHRSGRRMKKWKSGFSVGGLSVEGDDYRFLNFEKRAIRQGDEITLCVVDVAKTSRPKSQYVETKAGRLKSQRRYVKHLSKALTKKR